VTLSRIEQVTTRIKIEALYLEKACPIIACYEEAIFNINISNSKNAAKFITPHNSSI
jgi:hypothetical protein